ncbi:MAG TPA: FecR domain-containing protein [Gallionella sp.]
MNTTKNIAVYCSCAVLATGFLFASQSVHAAIAGRAQFVMGNVQLINAANQTRVLHKGDPVNEGDTVLTAKGANAQIKMQDGGFVAVRPESQLKFDSFKFTGKEDGSEKLFFSLAKGGFRSVTGLIGRINKPSYRINTAAATIGIRGTDHETFVVTPGSQLADTAPAGTYNKVNVGETYMATDKGTISVLPNQMGYASGIDQVPELKPLNTDIFTVADKPTKAVKSEEENGDEVRETATADSTAEAAAPATETASYATENTSLEIIQPITTDAGITLGGGTAAVAPYIPSNILISMTSGTSSNGWGNYFVAPADITYTAGVPTSFTQRSFDNTWFETFSVLGAGTPITGAANSGTTGIQFGRWASVTGVEQSSRWLLEQSGMQNFWMYGAEGYLDPGITALGGQMYGTFNYVLDGSTAPVDWQTGQTGTLTSATLSVDFVNSLVNANLGLTLSGTNWQVSAAGVPLGGSSFNTSTFGGNLAISMGVGTAPTLCTTCSGYLDGNFTGQNFAGAMLSYNLYDGNYTSNINGSAVMVRDPAVAITNGAAAPTGFYYVYSSYGGYQMIDTLTTTAGVLTSFSSTTQPSYYSSTTVTCTTCTVAAPTANTASTGIYYGTWDAGSITQTWGNTFDPFGPTWIAGPEAGPLFLGNALVGTKSFSFDGGMVTNAQGIAGTVLATSALTVNFTRQVVGVNLNLSVPDTATGALHSWNAATLSGNEAIIQSAQQGIGGVEFWADSYSPAGPGQLTVTVDGATPGNGSLSGQLTGMGFNGAILSYSLNAMIGATAQIYEQVNGVAAFAGAASDVATPYRLVMASLTEPNLQAVTPVSALGFYANAPTRMMTDASGNLTQFDISSVRNTNGTSGAMTLNSSTSTLANAGSDAVTGISWGRWDGGSMNVTDRATGTVSPTPLAGSLHWIAGPTGAGDVTLPVSGTYTYTNAGGTVPTDNLGNAGTLNSATLSANFTAQTVNVGVNVTVAGATMAGTAANVPIIQNTAFYADSINPATSASHLAVTCTGTCGTSTQGVILGGFTGTGATGAMMTYGFENTQTTGTQVISGVAAFSR